LIKFTIPAIRVFKADVATEPRPLAKRGSEPMAVLNNALGFGGHNVSLVFTAA
jgi:3-oxoacyl-(acyl-carrier-protein) synthase